MRGGYEYLIGIVLLSFVVYVEAEVCDKVGGCFRSSTTSTSPQTVECSANSTCNYYTFNCTATVCDMQCIATNTCINAVFQCNQGSNCSVTCNGSNSCLGFRFTCDSTSICTGYNTSLPTPPPTGSPSRSRSNSPTINPSSPSSAPASSPIRPLNPTISLSCPSSLPSSFCLNNTLFINSSLFISQNSTVFLTHPVLVQGSIQLNYSHIVFYLSNDSIPKLTGESGIDIINCTLVIDVSATNIQEGSYTLIDGVDNAMFDTVTIVGEGEERCLKSNVEKNERTLMYVVTAKKEGGCGDEEGGGVNKALVGGIVGGVGGCIVIVIIVASIFAVIAAIKRKRLLALAHAMMEN
eukprot:TRINITY_DN4762_c0_g1_i1.p1 TRINITY_DN4762_c0_g1~~TRINITY_DN4762_c0_g1_i1.p1  ORF type:complete len:351 (-),score=44.85 TRINITY_DN4762_c0_g1_i1:139-1191(-)